ncbi:hypothetical protein DA2_2733 [Desulfovibrio sp. A2]|nr:hypothetical protein DA2_2733 [Desulfovibrio sp. A2]
MAKAHAIESSDGASSTSSKTSTTTRPRVSWKPATPQKSCEVAMPSAPRFAPIIPFEAQHPTPILPGRLPGVIDDFASAMATALQVPYELALANTLGAIAAAGQGKFCVSLHEGYTEPMNIYAVVILPPGERKSSVKDTCRAPLLAWEREQEVLLAKEVRLAKATQLVNEEARRAISAKAKRSGTPEARLELAKQIAQTWEAQAEPPVVPRLLADDATPEALAELMAQQKQRIAILEAEGGIIDTLFGRYSNGVPNLDLVLKAWGGEPVRVDRRNSAPLRLDYPALTMILSVQPDVLAGAAQHSAFRGRGLLSRFICLRPKSLVGYRKPTTPVPPRIIARYHLAVRTLLNYPETAAGNRGLGPHPIRLDDESQELWLQFGKRTEYALREGEQLAEMRDWGGKLPGQVLRIAGLCHLTMHAQPHQHRITSATMQAVIDLAEQLTEHTRATYALMGVDETVECAKAILRWLAQDRPLSFTARSAFEKVKGRWPKMDRINASLSELEDRGFIALDQQSGRGRGRPSRSYHVNPSLRPNVSPPQHASK